MRHLRLRTLPALIALLCVIGLSGCITVVQQAPNNGPSSTAGGVKTVELPQPIFLAFCDRSASITDKSASSGSNAPNELSDWTFHAGMIRIAMSQWGYDRKVYAHIFVFAEGLGTVYEGAPKDWNAVQTPLQKYIGSEWKMEGAGTMAIPFLEQAIKLVEANPDHPVYMMVTTDLLFNDVDKAKVLLRKLLKHDNVKKLVMGPIIEDPETRQNFMARLVPDTYPVDRVMLKSRMDLEAALRESAKDFKQYLPAEEE